MATEQYELSSPPSDGISSVKFHSTNPSLLLVGSWDKSLRLYDVHDNELKWSAPQKGAVLDVCWADKQVFTGGLDKKLKSYDANGGSETVLGTHDGAIRCLEYSTEINSVVTGSWDKDVKLWDPRAKEAEVGKYNQPDKIFSLDVTHEKLVVATAQRHILIYDMRNMSETLQRRESSMKYMTRMVRCMPNGHGYASSSIEGRVAVDFFDPSPEWQAKKYAFKCHRVKSEEGDTVYPVNALAYHPIHGTFASGGGDGVVNMWDGFNKKRLRAFPKYETSIASLSFNSDGNLLAVAASYTFEEGEKDHPPDSIFIKPMVEADTKPKVMPA
ncbi:mitotic spindle checkpoint protein Bub3 [Rhizophlyctis rosea]|nr:mitotic spindle checkpoint protein Bub3 [Rhizophlyctis rosea]